MGELATERPIFHSEADFQFALSTCIHAAYPGYKPRLEKPFRFERRTIYTDIWLPEEAIAIELKHFTQKLSVCIGRELFTLKDQAARDLARYGFLADVQRLEGLVLDEEQPVRTGFAVLLTNDPGLWNPPTRKYNDFNFQLNEGRSEVTGELPWLKKRSPVKGDEISLRGSYTMNWRAYSDLKCAAGEFRYLAVAVGGRD